MRVKAIPLLAIVLVLPAAGQESKSHPDFSGRWELVKEKSDFGNSSPPVRMTLVSEKRDSYLHSVQTTVTAEGEQVFESDWYPDGKQHKYDKPVPGYSTTRWEGQTLVSERKSDDGHYRASIQLTMLSNGREAIETLSYHTPEGDHRLRLFWRRQ